MLLSLIVTVAALAATLIAGASGAGTVAALAKMAASCGFLALAVTSGALHSNYGRVLLLGLVFSWWGDFFLIFSGPRIFLAGLIAFFLAHVAYSAAFLVHGVSVNATLLTLVALVVPVFVIYRWLNPHLDDLRGPVYAYMVIITLMVALAAGTLGKQGPLLILIGALLFYVSDLYVARGRFVAPGPWNSRIGLPLYYAGQLALAYSIRFAGK